uniref:Uncharacterized protein n=1 Tax=Anguilla anguilla TaxID=7936 RepID=A0A0E9VE14_ANGAN
MAYNQFIQLLYISKAIQVKYCIQGHSSSAPHGNKTYDHGVARLGP